MDSDDKLAIFVMVVVVWILGGTVTGATLELGLGLVDITGPTASTADFLGFMLLWPLFALKFLAIGAWAVLSAGFTLLV